MLFSKAGSAKDPVWYESCGLSDNSPICVCLGIDKKNSPKQLRTKADWCKHPAYHDRLDALCKLVAWRLLSLDDQSTIQKQLKRDAALYARDALFVNDPLSHSVTMTGL